MIIEDVATTPEAHHHIGKSENHPEDIGAFLRIYGDDPATKVRANHAVTAWIMMPIYCQNFLPKLKHHLLPRIKLMLSDIKSPTQDESSTALQGTEPVDFQEQSELDHILFKKNCMYRHNIIRINYTTYDVHRAQDVVNPNTSRCNIMLLASDNKQTGHPFIYARVLGIYHVNCIYVGPNMVDYHPRKLEFLWVRWYERVDTPAGWDALRLDRLSFPPMARDDSFGIVDPADVIRGFHCIPHFTAGKRHSRGLSHHVPALVASQRQIDGCSLSHFARDAEDWRAYYVGR